MHVPLSNNNSSIHGLSIAHHTDSSPIVSMINSEYHRERDVVSQAPLYTNSRPSMDISGQNLSLSSASVVRPLETVQSHLLQTIQSESSQMDSLLPQSTTNQPTNSINSSRLSLHGELSDENVGEASIEPSEVSALLTNHTRSGIVNDVSVLQPGLIEEETILDENERDDLFIENRWGDYNDSSECSFDEFLHGK